MTQLIETQPPKDRRGSPCRLSATEHADRVREAYVALFDEFRDWTPSRKFRDSFHAGPIAEIRRRLKQQDKIRILEVGCGNGTWAQEIFSTIEDADTRIAYHGVDFTEPRIVLARQRLARHPSAVFEAADVQRMQPTDRYDLILCIEVLSHVPRFNQANWLALWLGWLNPGGTAIILDKDRYSKVGISVAWDAFKRKWLPGRLAQRTHYFPAHYGDYVNTLYYPSFKTLQRQATKIGLGSRPIIENDSFRVLLLDKKSS